MSSQALAITGRGEESLAVPDKTTFFLPDNLAESIKLCEWIASSQLVPKNYMNKPADIFVAAKYGQALGLSVLQSVIAIAVINGRPGIFGDDQLAVVQSHPAYEGHKEFWEGEGEKLTAVFQIKRRNQEPHESRFSVADAKLAGLWDTRDKINSREGGEMRNPSPWHCYPKRMLQMRARAFGLRDKFADALRGMKSVEELQDYPQVEGTFSASPIEQGTTGSAPAPAPAGTGNGNNNHSQTQTPDEAAVLKQEAATFAAEWHNTSKLNHPTKDARAYLKDVLKVESSLDIAIADRKTAMEWAKTPAAKTSAEAPNTHAAAFNALGWAPKQQEEYLAKMSKFSEAQIRADLNRLVDEQNKSQ